MKRIKRGRGPSMMSGASSVFAAIFGVIWICAAASMGAPGFFLLFGVLFIVAAVGQAAYHFTNATGDDRFSEFDIVDSAEEGDPADGFFRNKRNEEREQYPERTEAGVQPGEARFCPYCGTPAEDGFLFCSRCGKKLP